MSLSEKTARMVSKYVVKLVRRQPVWLRDLFDRESITFGMEDDGSLVLYVDPHLDSRVKNHARILIEKYMKQYPCKAIQSAELIQ